MVSRRRLFQAALLALAACAAGWSLAWTRSFAAQGSALAHSELPYYSHADFRPRWDLWSRHRTVGRLRLTGHDGRALDQSVFARGPTIVGFFWSGCLSSCPVSLELLRSAYADMGGAKPQVILISDQPTLDSVEAIGRYARQFQLPQGWRLATGGPRDVYGFAYSGLFTDVAAPGPDGGPRHTEAEYLIDRQGRLRGVYDANSPAALIRLRADYARLAAERAV